MKPKHPMKPEHQTVFTRLSSMLSYADRYNLTIHDYKTELKPDICYYYVTWR